jgi:solute carrier family 25 phosphate transporter 3
MSKETRAKLSPTANFSIMLGSGVIAGFAAAILSQPADTLLSQINKGHGPKGSVLYRLGVLAKQTGFKGLFAGLGPRMVMTAGLVSGQFLIYDAIKQGACVPKGPFSDVFADDVQISDGRPTWCGDS